MDLGGELDDEIHDKPLDALALLTREGLPLILDGVIKNLKSEIFRHLIFCPCEDAVHFGPCSWHTLHLSKNLLRLADLKKEDSLRRIDPDKSSESEGGS